MARQISRGEWLGAGAVVLAAVIAGLLGLCHRDSPVDARDNKGNVVVGNGNTINPPPPKVLPHLEVDAIPLSTAEYVRVERDSERSLTVRFRVHVKNTSDAIAYDVHTDPLDPAMHPDPDARDAGHADIGPHQGDIFNYMGNFECPDPGSCSVAPPWHYFVTVYYAAERGSSEVHSTKVAIDLWPDRALIKSRVFN